MQFLETSLWVSHQILFRRFSSWLYSCRESSAQETKYLPSRCSGEAPGSNLHSETGYSDLGFRVFPQSL